MKAIRLRIINVRAVPKGRALLVLAGCMLAACGAQAPQAAPKAEPDAQPPLAAAPEAEATPPVPAPSLYRFTETMNRLSPMQEVKVRIGAEYRNVLSAPYRSARKELALGDDLAIRLGDLVDVAALSEDATGIAFALSVNETTLYAYAQLDDSTDRAQWAERRVRLAPDGTPGLAPGMVFPMWARETRPAATIEIPRVTIPANACLALGYGFEPSMEATPRTLRFSVELDLDGKRRPVFTRELTTGDEEFVRGAGWHDTTIDLSKFAGSRVRFFFRTGPLGEAGEAGAGSPDTSSAVWANPILYAKELRDEDPRPNVIIVSLDTLRADHVGAYGYARDTTPNLDRFAEEAYLFERCIAPSSWTTPSHASLFTGLNPAVHRANGLSSYRLRDSFTTLAEILREQGYLTAAFTEGGLVGGQLGFGQGFDLYSNGPSVQPAPPGEAEHTFADAAQWLEGARHRPFFLFVHTYEIHDPYMAPEPYTQQFVPLERRGEKPYETPSLGLLGNEIPVEDRQTVIDMYDGGIAYTDQVLGQFVESLRTRGLLDNTLMIVLSDHGEEFGEHNGTIHGLNLYNEVLHVPFLVRLPGTAGAHGRIATPIGMHDAFATVLDYLSVESPPLADSFSLRPLMENAEADYDRDLIVSQLLQLQAKWLFVAAQDRDWKYILTTDYSVETCALNEYLKTYQEECSAAIERELVKYAVNGGLDVSRATTEDEVLAIRRSAREELFDLKQDSQERKNANDAEALRVKEWRERLDASLSAFANARGEAAHLPDEDTAPLNDVEREEIRALGYL